MTVNVTVSENWDAHSGRSVKSSVVFEGKFKGTSSEPDTLVMKALAKSALKYAKYFILKGRGDDGMAVKKNLKRAQQALEEYEFYIKKALHAREIHG